MMLRYRRLIDGDQVFSFLRKKSQTRRMTAYRIKLFTEHDTRRRLKLHFNSLPVFCALALVFAAGCTPSAQVPGQRQVQTQTRLRRILRRHLPALKKIPLTRSDSNNFGSAVRMTRSRRIFRSARETFCA